MVPAPTTALKIEYDQNGCIGCGVCERLCPSVWEMTEIEGEEKAILKKIHLDPSEVRANKEAAECCPTQVILLINAATGKQISDFERSQYHEQSPPR